LFPLDFDIAGARSHRITNVSIPKLEINCIPSHSQPLSFLATRHAAHFDKPQPIAYNTMQL